CRWLAKRSTLYAVWPRRANRQSKDLTVTFVSKRMDDHRPVADPNGRGGVLVPREPPRHGGGHRGGGPCLCGNRTHGWPPLVWSPSAQIRAAIGLLSRSVGNHDPQRYLREGFRRASKDAPGCRCATELS